MPWIEVMRRARQDSSAASEGPLVLRTGLVSRGALDVKDLTGLSRADSLNFRHGSRALTKARVLLQKALRALTVR